MSKYTEGIPVDEKALNMMMLRILREESNNQKTKARSEKQMVDRIMKIIEEEVNRVC